MSAATDVQTADAQPLERLRDGLARFPSGVTVVTARDEDGVPWGFTASSFCSVSADPPLVLVCLATSARCYPVFAATDEITINILSADQEHLARVFASRDADKLAAAGVDPDPTSGHRVIVDPLVRLRCRTHDRLVSGDHLVLIGRVRDVEMHDGVPLLYADRGFRSLPASDQP